MQEHLGRQIDLNLEFIAENGYPVPLKSFFRQGKPVLLTLAYYQCPMLCNLVLNGQAAGMKELAWTPGDEYEAVTVSIHPNETFNLALNKKLAYVESLGRGDKGWHFLSDTHDNARKLANQVGFQYRYDARQDQYAHPAVVLVLTPDGRVSRYLYGIQFTQRNLRLALTEASEYKLGNTIEKLLLFCYHYDPAARSYVPFARNFMRGGGVLIVLALGITMYRLFRAERARESHHLQPAEGSARA